MGKRKDNNGRVLKMGESQRANGTYDFRYTNAKGKRCFVYAKTLDELRRKEESVQRDMMDGIDSEAGEMTVIELVDRYLDLRRSLKPNSMRAYSTAVRRIRAEPFGQRKVNSVKMSDAKSWLVYLHDTGLKQNTISTYYNVLHPAFEMAVDDDAIRKNPFKFRLSDLIPNDAETRTSLTKEQEHLYLDFIRRDNSGTYYEEIEILLQTGLRVSELYGLTKADVDLDRRQIHINKQLCRTGDKPYFITSPKTDKGIRCIPMTDTSYNALCGALEKRVKPKVEMIVDGYGGFLFLDKDGRPKTAMHLQGYMRRIGQKIAQVYGNVMPKVTPHVLRHPYVKPTTQTFSTFLKFGGFKGKITHLPDNFNLIPRIDIHSLNQCIDQFRA